MFRLSKFCKTKPKPKTATTKVNPNIRNLVNTRMLEDDARFLKLRQTNNQRYQHSKSLCQNLNRFIHSPEVFNKIKNSQVDRIQNLLKEIDLLQPGYLKKSTCLLPGWRFNSFGSTVTGLNNQVVKSDFDLSLAPDKVSENDSGMNFETVVKINHLVLNIVSNLRENDLQSGKFNLKKYDYKSPNISKNRSDIIDHFPIIIIDGVQLPSKPNLQVTMFSGLPHQKLFDIEEMMFLREYNFRHDLSKKTSLPNHIKDTSKPIWQKNSKRQNDEEELMQNYEIVINRAQYNVINSNYLRLYSENSLNLFKFLIVLKSIIKNTKTLNEMHSFTSYAINILAITFLQDAGFLRVTSG